MESIKFDTLEQVLFPQIIEKIDSIAGIHAFFISNTFISNARLKFANIQNLSRKI